jgi:hypothetical protein
MPPTTRKVDISNYKKWIILRQMMKKCVIQNQIIKSWRRTLKSMQVRLRLYFLAYIVTVGVIFILMQVFWVALPIQLGNIQEMGISRVLWTSVSFNACFGGVGWWSLYGSEYGNLH